MKVNFWVSGMFLIACGGSSVPAESPADAEQADSQDAAAQSSEVPSAHDSERASSSESAPSSATNATASKEDMQAILQLVIDDAELTPFLRLEQPDRFPLRVAGDLPAGVELTKATKPVEIVPDTDTKKKPVIVFTDIEVSATRATVRYRYDVENVRGSCSLEKRDGSWVLAKSRITVR